MSIHRRSLLAAVAGLSAAACSSTGIVTSQLSISVDPLALNFGNQTSGTHTSKTLTIHNDGPGTITLSGIAIANDARGAFSLGATPKALSASSSATLQVTYSAPAAEGSDGATLTISSNADNAPTLSVPLSGRSVLGCLPESDVAFCIRLGKNCGAVTAADNCDVSRTVASCGTCNQPQTCAGSVPNVCTTPRLAVTVTLAGTGSGTVTSSPAGISCGGTCSASFDQGSTVTLTPAAAIGSTFGGFSGDCIGSTCSLIVGAARHVTATFVPLRTLTVTTAGNGPGAITSPGSSRTPTGSAARRPGRSSRRPARCPRLEVEARRSTTPLRTS